MLKHFVNTLGAVSMSLAAIALLALTGFSANAQTVATEVATETVLTHNSGCKLVHPSSSAVTQSKLLNIAANCVNGFYEGVVLYGVYWRVKFDGEPADNFQALRVGYMQQGRFQGPRLHINMGGRLTMVRADGSLAFRADVAQHQYKLQDLLTAINTETARTGGAYANAINAHLFNIAQTWDTRADQIVSAYVQDESNPLVARADKPTERPNTAANTRDDPKVFGRSARGG